MRLGESRRVRCQSHGVAGSKQIHKSYLQETDGPGFPPLNPAFEPRPVAPPLTETPQPDGRWEAHACALLLGPHLPDGEAGLWTEAPGEVLSRSRLRQKQRPPRPPPKLPRACHSFPAALPDPGVGTGLTHSPAGTQRAGHVGAASPRSGVPARDPSPRSPRTHTFPSISERERKRGTFGSSRDTLLACHPQLPELVLGPRSSGPPCSSVLAQRGSGLSSLLQWPEALLGPGSAPHQALEAVGSRQN